MKKLLLMAAAIVAMTACSGNKTESYETIEPEAEATEAVNEDVVVDTTLPEDTEDATESAQTGTDWDKFLDEYENYCTKLAGLSKKAMAGDLSAMSDYASLLESAEALQSKLEDAESEMSAAQIARLNKIIQKMAQAAM